MKKEQEKHWCLGSHAPEEKCNDIGEFPSPEDQEGPIIIRDLPKKSNQ